VARFNTLHQSFGFSLNTARQAAAGAAMKPNVCNSCITAAKKAVHEPKAF
jgi:hypothetical protein